MLPIGEAYCAPKVHFQAKQPSKDADARYAGVDFAGTLSSATSVATAIYEYIYPANATLFPRLNAIAKAFVRYRFKNLRFILHGKSASTQKGLGSFGSLVTDLLGGSIAVGSASVVKNSEGVLTLRGWETGGHEVAVDTTGLKWLINDTDAGATGEGSMLGFTFYSIEATTAAGDLSWDLYVEYDVEFAEAWLPAGINMKPPKEVQADSTSVTSDETIKKLLEEIQRLRKATGQTSS